MTNARTSLDRLLVMRFPVTFGLGLCVACEATRHPGRPALIEWWRAERPARGVVPGHVHSSNRLDLALREVSLDPDGWGIGAAIELTGRLGPHELRVVRQADDGTLPPAHGGHAPGPHTWTVEARPVAGVPTMTWTGLTVRHRHLGPAVHSVWRQLAAEEAHHVALWGGPWAAWAAPRVRPLLAAAAAGADHVGPPLADALTDRGVRCEWLLAALRAGHGWAAELATAAAAVAAGVGGKA